MSLLMDALKRAEREKKRVASKKTSEKISPVVSHEDDPTEPLSRSYQQSKRSITKKDQKDESWAFDTGEMELEPVTPNTSTETDNDPTSGMDDTTIQEPLSDQTDQTIPSNLDDFSSQQTDSTFRETDFDHDVTLPSERAIQSSLKDYFDTSQSVTLNQNDLDDADITTQTIADTSPQDLSATHVTAHTIFTAGQSRRASTGLAKYALLGTLFLALGLGAVALYYSYVTPTTVNNMPAVASIKPTKEPSNIGVEVNVNTVETNPISNDTSLTTEHEDPVLAAVVEEVSPSSKPDSTQSIENGSAVIEMVEEAQVNISPAKKVPVKETVFIEETIAPSTYKAATPTTWTPPPQEKGTPKYAKKEHEIINFSLSKSAIKPEKIIALNDPQHQTKTFKKSKNVSRNQNRTNNLSKDQPLEVMSAEDFADGLTMPKSAIKITKGRLRRVNNSDLTNAYRAYQTGDYLNAKAAYRKVLSRRPDNRDALLGVAAIAVMEGKYETAYGHYQYLLQQNPQDQIAKAAMFNLQGNAGGNVNESQLKLSLDQNPDSPQIHFSLGSFYAGQSRWSEAQKSFFDAFSADRNNPDYAYNLAVSLDQIGQPKPALNYYRSALKLAQKTSVNFNTSQVLRRIQKLSGIVNN